VLPCSLRDRFMTQRLRWAWVGPMFTFVLLYIRIWVFRENSPH